MLTIIQYYYQALIVELLSCGQMDCKLLWWYGTRILIKQEIKMRFRVLRCIEKMG